MECTGVLNQAATCVANLDRFAETIQLPGTAKRDSVRAKNTHMAHHLFTESIEGLGRIDLALIYTDGTGLFYSTLRKDLRLSKRVKTTSITKSIYAIPLNEGISAYLARKAELLPRLTSVGLTEDHLYPYLALTEGAMYRHSTLFNTTTPLYPVEPLDAATAIAYLTKGYDLRTIFTAVVLGFNPDEAAALQNAPTEWVALMASDETINGDSFLVNLLKKEVRARARIARQTLLQGATDDLYKNAIRKTTSNPRVPNEFIFQLNPIMTGNSRYSKTTGHFAFIGSIQNTSISYYYDSMNNEYTLRS